MLFSHIMKQNSNTCNNMNETWKYFTEENKPDRKHVRAHTHTAWFSLYARPIIGNHIESKRRLAVPGLRGRKGEWELEGVDFFLGWWRCSGSR